jgi:hypothetical protein
MNDAVTEYMRFLREKQLVTVKDYMEPALRARIGAFAPPAERDFFAQVEAREPFLLRCHGYHWFDLARMEREPHQSPIRRVPLLYNISGQPPSAATVMEGRWRASASTTAATKPRAGLRDDRPARRARPLGPAHTPNQLSIGRPCAPPSGPVRLAEARRHWCGASIAYLAAAWLAELSHREGPDRDAARRARGSSERFTLQRFMDELNASGRIPVSMIRWEMTGRDDDGAERR